jgi:hypothetical protein
VGTLHLAMNVLTVFATELSDSAKGMIPTLDITIGSSLVHFGRANGAKNQ